MVKNSVIENIADHYSPKPLFCPLSQTFDAFQYGISYREYATNAKKMAQCELIMAKKFHYDWIFFPIDPVVELETLGIKAGPKIEGQMREPWSVMESSALQASHKTLRKLDVPDPTRDGRMPLRIDAINLVKREVSKGNFCVTGYVEGPFTIACYLYGIEQSLKLLLKKPSLMKRTIDFMTEVDSNYGLEQIKAGADAIFIADLFSASNFISKEHFNSFAFKAIRKLIEAFHKAGAITFLHFNEPRIDHLEEMANLSQYGDIVLTVGSGGDFTKAKRVLGDKVCLMGGLDPLKLKKERNYPLSVLKKISEQDMNYILSTNAAMAFNTPPENVEIINTAIERFYGGK